MTKRPWAKRIGAARLNTTGAACMAVLGLAIFAGPGRGQAATVERYVAMHGGIRLELSAPRADIIRIRAGQSALPEDASWAVTPEIRAKHAPIDVTETGDVVELRTSALIARLNRATLALSIVDTSGRVLLADAAGEALRFENGGFRLRKAMPDDAHYFGLGDKTGGLDRRGSAFALWNTDAFGFGVASDPIYKSIPFVLGVEEDGHSFGLFMDNTWRSFFDFGKSERNAFSFGAEGGPVDYYVLGGPNPKAIVEAYAYLTGKAPLTPLWALGFQQSHWSYPTQAEVQGIADRLRHDRIPADVLYMDIDYQDRNRPFTVDKKAFPDLPALSARLAAQGFHLVLITDLHIAEAPGQNYRPFDSGSEADLFLKRPDGSVYVGEVWPGRAVFPDFSRQSVRDWWGRNYAGFVGLGVSGFWNDMNEPAIFKTPTKTMPLDTVHRIEEPGFAPRTASHAELHNVYGMLNSRATYDGLRTIAADKRPFVLTRATYAGGQRYAATWTGDNSSSWAHLKLSTSQLINLGLSGFAYSGDDIGGFAGEAPSADLLTRWIEIGAFNPIFRDHYQKDKAPQEPWVHGAQHEDIRRRYIEERYRLLPYIYALAEENSRNGLPIMRPVFLEFPQVLARGDRLGDTEDEFMLGRNLLVAPSPTGESPAAYKIALPDKGWYDYWTGQRLSTAQVVETPTLERLPVFVRPGAIIAKQPLVQSTTEQPVGRLEIHIYPGSDCSGALYLDEGDGFGYQRGEFLRQTLRCDARALHFGAREGSFKPWWSGFHVVIHGWAKPPSPVTLGGKKIAASVDSAAQVLEFDLPDQPEAASITIAP